MASLESLVTFLQQLCTELSVQPGLSCSLPISSQASLYWTPNGVVFSCLSFLCSLPMQMLHKVCESLCQHVQMYHGIIHSQSSNKRRSTTWMRMQQMLLQNEETSITAWLWLSSTGCKVMWWQVSFGVDTQLCVSSEITGALAGNGCPICRGLQACKCNSLLSLHPDIAHEWGYGKNDGRPNDYTARSHAVVWWKSKAQQSWQQTIDSRTDKRLVRHRSKATWLLPVIVESVYVEAVAWCLHQTVQTDHGSFEQAL